MGIDSQDINNERRGTVYVRNHQRGRLSRGVRTNYRSSGVENVADMVYLAQTPIASSFGSLPVFESMLVKLDGGAAWQIETYQQARGSGHDGAGHIYAGVQSDTYRVPWYDIANDDLSLVMNHVDPRLPPGYYPHADPGQYMRETPTWVMTIPFWLSTSPLDSSVRGMVKRTNTNAISIGGQSFGAYRAVLDGIEQDVVETGDGQAYTGYYSIALNESGWFKRQACSTRAATGTGQQAHFVVEMLTHEKASWVDLPATDADA